jgi:hypothetical protein
MSNYTKGTNFATKDTLPTGDSGKIVKGTEIDSEFNAIASSISSKADTASPTFTGTPAAPTAAGGTNTTQLATTAFVTGAISNNNTTERAATVTLTNKTISADNNTISGIAASSFVVSNSSGNVDGTAAQKAIPAGVVVGTTDTQTITNKTIALGSNTVSGTKAQFNTAVTDTDLVFVNDFSGSNQSLTADGYQKLPSGLIMQWGTIASLSGGTTVTYPIAFPSACVNVQTCIIASSDTNEIAYVSSVGNTTFVVTNSNPSAKGIYWSAIGY